MLLRWLAPLTFVALTLFSAGAGGAGVPPVRMPIRIVEPASQIELRSSHDARALERPASAAA